MANTILVHHDGAWAPLRDTPYAREDILQEMIATWPELLAADAPPGSQARLLLVSREIAVPDAAEAAGRWALDHLFIDQAGTPTLVETKRSSDTRARREVVAQMLDYAANAIVYWPIEFVQMQLQARCSANGLDPDVVVSEFLDGQMTPEQFWQRVKVNLQAGRVRMLFVADQIGPELQRIIEFLNQQMDPAEVLGLELRQYHGESLQTLVPRWVGQTASASGRKAASPVRTEAWTRSEFLEAVRQQHNETVAALIETILDWAEKRGLIVRGEKASSPGISLLAPAATSYLVNITAYASGPRLYLSFAAARRKGVSDDQLSLVTDQLAALAQSRAAPVSNRDYPGIVLDQRTTSAQGSASLIELLGHYLKLVVPSAFP